MTESSIRKLIEDFKNELLEINEINGMEAIWKKYLADNGHIKKFLKEIKDMPSEEKKVIAPLIQQHYKDALNLFEEKKLLLNKSDLAKILDEQAENLDYSLPKIGHLHPISKTIREMNSIFVNMGYSIMDGLEIEEDEYCFQRLNVPLDHPARDMQDTLYIKEPTYLLRTQTSSIESRTLANYKPPFKIVSPGRVYRNESVNKSNHFIFHHYQGVVVVEKTSLKDLFGTLNVLFKKMYGADVVVRYRNKYYPEVEPGVGPDMQCFNCHGKGCSLCKNVGWIEMGGAGIIHPNVMQNAGINSKKWMGFAFGLGLDRWVMAKYKITDIRTLLGGNLGYKYYENENII
ncbi:MAG: phenylalanine--tRNA ligase subunit alpha [Candidatus Pacebacteria bacterium]|nr:phenylalanine--tRNA ligase subunit alpha [Candidatus Paceibacterota bacterium]